MCVCVFIRYQLSRMCKYLYIVFIHYESHFGRSEELRSSKVHDYFD